LEPEIRGLIEKELDSALKDENLEKLYKMLKALSSAWLLESPKSAFIGYLYGHLNMNLIMLYRLRNRKLTQASTAEIILVLNRRITEINTKIDKILNK